MIFSDENRSKLKIEKSVMYKQIFSPIWGTCSQLLNISREASDLLLVSYY